MNNDKAHVAFDQDAHEALRPTKPTTWRKMPLYWMRMYLWVICRPASDDDDKLGGIA